VQASTGFDPHEVTMFDRNTAGSQYRPCLAKVIVGFFLEPFTPYVWIHALEIVFISLGAEWRSGIDSGEGVAVRWGP
jgi:hypothetical protein